MNSIKIPANFGEHRLKSEADKNFELKLLDYSETIVKANSLVLGLNSPVFDEIITEQGKTSVSFGYSEQEARKFVEACYLGKLDITKFNTLHGLCKISDFYKVYWMADVCFHYFCNRVRDLRHEDLAEGRLEQTTKLFKVAASSVRTFGKRNFVEILGTMIRRDSRARDEFVKITLGNSLKTMRQTDLGLLIELAGEGIDGVVSVLVNHIFELKHQLDNNAQYLLENINFAYVSEVYPDTLKMIEDVLCENDATCNKFTMNLISKARTKIPYNDKQIEWNKNIHIPNLFNEIAVKNPTEEDPLQSLPSCSSQQSDSQEFHDALDCPEYFEEKDSAYSSFHSIESKSPCKLLHHHRKAEADELWTMIDKLADNDKVKNFYMVVEALWELLIVSVEPGDDLITDFEGVAEELNNIRIHRGWFPISSQFLDRLDRSGSNKNAVELLESIKKYKKSVCDKTNKSVRASSNSIWTILESGVKSTVKFHLQSPNSPACETSKPGHCGFLLNISPLKQDTSDSFMIRMGYNPAEYPEDLHPHTNLVFAQHMHLALTSPGRNSLFPVSWSGRPRRVEGGVIWGRYRYGGCSGESGDEHEKYYYEWRKDEEAQFEIYYNGAGSEHPRVR